MAKPSEEVLLNVDEFPLFDITLGLRYAIFSQYCLQLYEISSLMQNRVVFVQ